MTLLWGLKEGQEAAREGERRELWAWGTASAKLGQETGSLGLGSVAESGHGGHRLLDVCHHKALPDSWAILSAVQRRRGGGDSDLIDLCLWLLWGEGMSWA